MLYKKGEMSMLHSKSVVTVPPGATIREQLDTRGMNQKEFAKRMGMTEKHISHLINGKVELTQEVALRLESVLGLPASFWNNLESLYREKIARIRAEREMERDEIIARQIPYSKIAKLGWVPATKNIGEKVIHLRAFFEVAQLNLLCNLQVPGIAYRKMGENATSDYALAVWAQKARLEARSVEVSPICISALKESIAAIRALTIESPEVFCNKLRELLSDCGIAIVFLPHIGGSFLHGASFMDGNHIVVGVTVRGKDADRFWFSLFHELFHIIEGHIFKPSGADVADERAADQFARDTLIPPREYLRLTSTGTVSEHAIKSFANEINIHPGIVLGRLQKENIVPYNRYTHLKTQYRIAG